MRTYVKPEIVLDPSFPIPPGAQGIRNDDKYVVDSGDGEETTDELAVPQSMVVVDYERRFADDGTLVIDVIVEVDDIEHIVKYDVRKSKL